MSQNLREKAEKLAHLPYTVEVALDETTRGQVVYLARTIELEGCMGQGETIEEAIEDLRLARIDYIQSLLEDGVTVPFPAPLTTTTGAAGSSIVTLSNRHKVRESPSRLYEASMITS